MREMATWSAQACREAISGGVFRAPEATSVWPPALAAYVVDFAADRFFEAHEDLEPLWWERGSDPLLQGLILFAAAFVKVQRGSAGGARKHFAAAVRYLEPHGVDVAGVCAHARACMEALAPYASPGAPPLPAGAIGRVVPRYAFPQGPGGCGLMRERPAAPGAPGVDTLRAALAAALAERRAAGEPVGPASWGPLVKEVARRTGGMLPRALVRAEVRRALAEGPAGARGTGEAGSGYGGSP